MPNRVPLRALLVEDDDADAALILDELARAGYDLEYARVSTEDAFLSALNTPWDVILCDYKLPAVQRATSDGADANPATGAPPHRHLGKHR